MNQTIKEKVIKANALCCEYRDKMDRVWIVDQTMRGELEFALADMRDNLWLLMVDTQKQKIQLDKESLLLWKAKKWTYRTDSEEKANMSKDIQLELLDATNEYELENIWIQNMERNIRTHTRIAEYYKSCVIGERSDAKRIDTMLSSKQDSIDDIPF